MKLKKNKEIKKQEIESPKEEPVNPNAELELAKYKLAYFEEKRRNSTTPEELKNFSFWVAHFKKLVEDLSK